MHRRAFLAATLACGVASTARAQSSAPLSHRFAGAASYSADRDGAALLVARNGVVLAEDYPGGPRDTRWRIGAGTRVFAPLLAASLVSDRLLSLDEPAAVTLGEWGADPVKSQISIRAILHGTSGLAFDRHDNTDVQTALALTPVAAPGDRFVDDAAPYVLLAEIARRKLLSAGRPPDPAGYLTDRTLFSIGCVPIGWTRSDDGAPRFDDGVVVSARGWTQVGELIRREGVWRAEQIADADALREARLGSFAEAHAGMGLFIVGDGRARTPPTDSDLWRMNPPAPVDCAMAAGMGGQRMYLIPSRSTVVVRMARTLEPHDWSDAVFLSLVLRDL